jgi:hypothetical protein
MSQGEGSKVEEELWGKEGCLKEKAQRKSETLDHFQ